MSTLLQSSVQCGAVQCTVWFSLVCSAVQCGAVWSSLVYSVIQWSMQCGAVQCTMLFSAVCSAVQYIVGWLVGIFVVRYIVVQFSVQCGELQYAVRCSLEWPVFLNTWSMQLLLAGSLEPARLHLLVSGRVGQFGTNSGKSKGFVWMNMPWGGANGNQTFLF